MTDLLQRFIFEETDIRGELTRLEQSYQDTLSAHNYPQVVARLLGEFMAAASLLSATLKFEGTLTLQANSEGEVPLIMAEVTSGNDLRAIARNADLASSEDFSTLLTNGRLAITITPTKGQRYQGIVNLDGHNLAECLEGYFKQSEQLATRIWLFSDGSIATGMLLQELPASDISPEQRQLDWEHLTHLADTITHAELSTLTFEQCLHRLYHQDPLRLFDAEFMRFKCSCSEERTLKALASLGKDELQKMVDDKHAIDVNCEFCHQHYHFQPDDIEKLIHPTLH